MAQSAKEVARAAMLAYEALESFEATQKISAGAISAEARIRYKKPNKITVEYRTYQDPLSEFEERVVGGVEFIADELIGMQLVYDGHGTWLYEAKNGVAIHKLGRTLFPPLRGTNVLAEIGFLHGLTRDFLLRDEGVESIAGLSAYRLGLKPKEPHRSLLLKEEDFPLKKATVTLDAKTSFPLKITYYPSSVSTLFYLVGPSTPVTIEYADLRLNKVDEERFSFKPPEGTRVFREKMVSQDTLNEELPFAVPLDNLEQHLGYKLYGNRVTVTINDDKDRAYALLALVPSQKEESEGSTGPDREPHILSLRVGNYLSRNMSRRRAFLSEQGEKLALGDTTAQFLDRGTLLKDQFTEAAVRNILELGWEKDGVYWFLLGEELEKTTLIDVANVLAQPQLKRG